MASGFSEYANALAMREQDFRTASPNIAAMTGPMASIEAQTGAPSTINPQEIAAISGLANLQAVANTQSTQRQQSGARLVKRMPNYVKSYRNYLQWRYPTRYGGGGSGYSSAPGTDFTIGDLPPIESPKGYGK